MYFGRTCGTDLPGVGHPGLHTTSRNRACLLTLPEDLTALCVTEQLSLFSIGRVCPAGLVSRGGVRGALLLWLEPEEGGVLSKLNPRSSDLGGGAHSTP